MNTLILNFATVPLSQRLRICFCVLRGGSIEVESPVDELPEINPEDLH